MQARIGQVKLGPSKVVIQTPPQALTHLLSNLTRALTVMCMAISPATHTAIHTILSADKHRWRKINVGSVIVLGLLPPINHRRGISSIRTRTIDDLPQFVQPGLHQGLVRPWKLSSSSRTRAISPAPRWIQFAPVSTTCSVRCNAPIPRNFVHLFCMC